MCAKALKKNTSFSENINILALAIIIPALIGSIWLISTLLIAVGLGRASSQPVSLFLLSFFGIYFQAVLVGILSPLLLKNEAKNPFVVLFFALAGELLALFGFYCFLRFYYGSWFLPVITLTEPFNDSFFLIAISVIISLLYYWLFIFPVKPLSSIEEDKLQSSEEKAEIQTKNASPAKRKTKTKRKTSKKD